MVFSTEEIESMIDCDGEKMFKNEIINFTGREIGKGAFFVRGLLENRVSLLNHERGREKRREGVMNE